MKKLFIASLILLVLSVVFLVIYNFVFKKSSQETLVQESQQVSETFAVTEPTAVTNKITKISQEPILTASLEDQDFVLYVAKKSGIVKRMSVRGSTPIDVYNPAIGNVVRADWSPDPLLVLFTTRSNRHYYLDTVAQRSFLLNFAPDFVQWTGKQKRILYKKYDEATSERSLVIDTITSSETKKLADLPFRRVGFAEIPESLLAAFWPEADAFTPSELFTVSTVSPGDPKKIYSGAYGADYGFSPDGRTILMSATLVPGESKVSLATMTRDGAAFQDLNIPTFLPKTVWSRDNKTVYYAQPTNIPAGSVLPNEYMDGTFTTRDTFWKVDVTTGKKSRIINLDELPGTLDATDLFLSPDEDILFFINRIDGSLYRLNIL